MNKYLLIVLLILVSYIFLVMFVSVFLVRNRMDTRVFGEKFIHLNEKNEFRIKSNHNNLNILIIPLKNPALGDDGEYLFQVIEGGNVIREISFRGSNVGDPSDVRFQFEPIPGSAGKDYGVKFFIASGKTDLLVNVNSENDLSTQSYYRPQSLMVKVEGVISNWGRYIKNNMVFFALWLGGLVLLAYKGVKDEQK